MTTHSPVVFHEGLLRGESRHPRLIAQDPRFESRSASSVGATGIDASVLLAMGDGT